MPLSETEPPLPPRLVSLVGVLPPEISVEFLGVFERCDELINGRAAYVASGCRESRPSDSMLWYADRYWFCGRRLDVGSNAGVIAAQAGDAASPDLVSSKWSFSRDGMWREMPDVHCLAGLIVL